MATLIVKHRVADFDTWKKVFESMSTLRKEFGWTSHLVLRGVQDPNVVTIVNRVATIEGAKAYGQSPELRAAMANAGVEGPPEIWLSSEALEHAY